MPRTAGGISKDMPGGLPNLVIITLWAGDGASPSGPKPQQITASTTVIFALG